MEVLEKIVDLIAAVVWPVIVVVIIIIFRRELASVAGRISELKYKDITVKFERELIKAETRAEELGIVPEGVILGITGRKGKEDEELDRLIMMAEISPRAAIAEAWRSVEFAISEVAKRNDIDLRGPIDFRGVIKDLVKREILEKGIMGLFDELRILRNSAAHAREFPISVEDAVRYVDLTFSLAARIKLAK